MRVSESLGTSSFLADVLEGLSRPQKSIPGKYLWDERGSAIFDEITRCGDYYPTLSETALLQTTAPLVAKIVGAGACIVEFGSGASHKIRILLDAMHKPTRYVAIDISSDYLRAAAARIQCDYPDLQVLHVCADYSAQLPLLPIGGSCRILGFLSGISIGNMEPSAATALLGRVRETLGPSHLLIGQDPNIDAAKLQAAYGNPLMAAFHKNILVRLSREVGARIEVDAFRHAARFNKDQGRVEAHLVAQKPTGIVVGAHSICVAAGESIMTDIAWKYRPGAFRDLLLAAGWSVVRHWRDSAELSGLFLSSWQPPVAS